MIPIFTGRHPITIDVDAQTKVSALFLRSFPLTFAPIYWKVVGSRSEKMELHMSEKVRVIFATLGIWAIIIIQ